MPVKFYAAQRHRILKARYRVQNWLDYDRGLVRRFRHPGKAVGGWDCGLARVLPDDAGKMTFGG
jgi:hypothetical protein